MPGGYIHHFLIERADRIEGIMPRLREAYPVGEQRHLAGKRGKEAS